MISTLLILVAVSTAAARTAGTGGCPSTVTAMPEFQIEKWMGTWFEITRTPNWFQEGLTCVNITYYLEDPTHFGAKHLAVDASGARDMRVGRGKVEDEMEPAKLQIKFYTYTPWDTYWVIDTDYKTYALVWLCSDERSYEHAWIFSRKPELEPEVVDRLTKLGRSMGIRVMEDMVAARQTC